MWNWVGVVMAGLLNGSFAVPMKTARVWKFTHIWMVFSIVAMAVIPWVGVMIAVPRWAEVLACVAPRGWMGLIVLGFVWGVASLLYGVAVDRLGIALGFSIQLGLSIVLGALLPMIWSRAFYLRTARDALFFAGIILMVAGVILCAQAGGAKSAAPGTAGMQFRTGLVVAILGGIGAPFLNFGIQYGISLLTAAGQIPGDANSSLNKWVAWAVFLSAAAAPQAGYCFSRIVANRWRALFRAPGAGRDAGWVIVMSVVWATSVFLYGMSAAGLGRMGVSFGWPIFVGFIVLTSNAWGVILGEWREAAQGASRRMLAGSAMLIVAAVLIGQAKAGL